MTVALAVIIPLPIRPPAPVPLTDEQRTIARAVCAAMRQLAEQGVPPSLHADVVEHLPTVARIVRRLTEGTKQP